MRAFHTFFRTIIPILMLALATVQNAYASAKAGEASVYEGKTVTIALADAYQRTLRKATGVTYQWYSENNKYATVTSSTRYNAIVKGVKETSSCRVYFKCSYFIDGFYRTMDFYYVITVKATSVVVTSVILNKTSISLKQGNSYQLSASVYPSNATNKKVNWSSSNTSVATVSNGLVSAKSAGSATITCRAADGSGKYATCQVTVEAALIPVSSISLNKTAASMYVGDSFQLSATLSPSNADDKKVTWSSDNKAVATVDSHGLVSAKSAGTANIIATTSNNLTAVCVVTVKDENKGEKSQWAGLYRVASYHVENYPTKEYQDNYEMTITEKDGICYITSMFGENLETYNDGGFKLQDNGNGTASIDVSYYNILKYTDNGSPLYALYVFDEINDDWSDTWMLTKNEDGSITVSDFYVAAFTWDEDEKIWKDGQLEAFYYLMTASKDDVSGISEFIVESPDIRVENGAIRLAEEVNVMVYKDNGSMIYSGKTNCVENLEKGLYIVRIGNQSKKILIR